jgi:hypothetical protein
MKNTIYFIAGILFTALISAGTISVMTVKPATPKGVIVLTTDIGSSTIEADIKEYVRKGYILKSLAGNSKHGGSWIAVMEKY